MIRGDAEPIGHRQPLPRIDLQPVWPVEAVDNDMRDEMWRFQRQVEADRIWKLVEQASEGNG